QPELAGDGAAGARGAEQGGGDTPGHVGAGAIVHERSAMPGEDGGDESRRGGLAVGGGDDHAALRQTPGEGADGAGIEAHEQLAGSAGAPAAAPGRGAPKATARRQR